MTYRKSYYQQRVDENDKIARAIQAQVDRQQELAEVAAIQNLFQNLLQPSPQCLKHLKKISQIHRGASPRSKIG